MDGNTAVSQSHSAMRTELRVQSVLEDRVWGLASVALGLVIFTAGALLLTGRFGPAHEPAWWEQLSGFITIGCTLLAVRWDLLMSRHAMG